MSQTDLGNSDSSFRVTGPNESETPPDRNRSALRWVLVAVAVAAALGAAWWGRSSETRIDRDLSVSWLTNSARIGEEAGSVEVVAMLSAPAPDELVIPFEVTGAATVDVDFRLDSDRFVFAPGEDRAAIEIELLDDGPSGERPERLVLEFGAESGVRVGRPGRFTLLITDSGFGVASPRGSGREGEDRGRRGAPSAPESAVAETVLGVTRLAEGTIDGAASVSTGRHAAGQDSVLLLVVASATSSAPTPVPRLGDANHRWELAGTSTRDDGPRRISMFRAATAPGGPVETLIEFDGDQEVIDWILLGVKGSTIADNGAAAVVQTASASAVDFELSGAVQLQPLQSSDSIVVGAFFIGANRAAGAVGFDTIATVGPPERILLAIAGQQASVVTAEWPTRAHWIGVAAEVGMP